MEWQIRSIARKSDVSGVPFAPGDRVVSLLFKDESGGDLGRADLLEGEAAGFEVPGRLLGRWTRLVKEPDSDGKPQEGDGLQSAEEFFLSLFEGEPDPSTRAETDALKHLLSLMLERKRVLRRAGAAAGGSQPYRHVKREAVFDVPVVDIPPPLLLELRETLGDLLL